jgi:2-iminobutanoate/2-iminopropanoate deaminase
VGLNEAMSVEPMKTSAEPLGPYTPAVRAGDWIVISGQIGVDPATGDLVDGGLAAQVAQALANLSSILGECRCTWEHVAKTTLFIATKDPDAMPEVKSAYEAAAGEHRPARSTVGVDWLPNGALFEIEAWVYKPLNRPEAA